MPESIYNNVSPKYMMELGEEVEKNMWDMFSSYQKVELYTDKWHESYGSFEENFSIYKKEGGNKEDVIDLTKTLHIMPNDILIKVAIDLGVDTPNFLPAVSEIKNKLKGSNENANKIFSRALKNVYENPDEAIDLANSALESIVKDILSEGYLEIEYNERDTLYDLTSKVLKGFKMYPKKDREIKEVTRIGSSFLTINQNIETLRSSKTKSHGKTKDGYLIEDPLWAEFVINSITTVGKFIIDFYENKYKPTVIEEGDDITPEDIPF